MKQKIGTILLILLFLTGFGIFSYPFVSNWWNTRAQSRRVVAYDNIIHAQEFDASVAEQKKNAKDWNRKLYASGTFQIGDYENTRGDAAYEEQLSLLDDGMMGYIHIEKIGQTIPIYHYATNTVLDKGIGHLPGTSLPIGGENTNCVLSGHRGLPSAKLFTDLDQMREGDTFTITVLNQMISYEVDQIRIVEPGDISELAIVPGEDYCTLVTCTPYGINTHRLLIRGHRVANEAGELVVPAEAFRIPNYITIPAIGVPLLFLSLIAMLIVYGRRRPKVRRADLYRMIEEVTEPTTPTARPRQYTARPTTQTTRPRPAGKPAEEKPKISPEDAPADRDGK